MPNPYVNKVVQSNGTTLIDISDTTAVAADVASGKYFYLATGEKVEGTAGGGGTREIVIPEQSITASTQYNAITNYAEALITGEQYICTVDGVEYGPFYGVEYYGSIAIGDENTNGWLFEYDRGMYFTVIDSSLYGSHSVKVEKVVSGGGGSAVLISKSVTANGTYRASDDSADGYSDITVNVPTSGSKNVQIAQGVNRVATTTYTEVSGQTLTVSKTGTYDVYWAGYRSSTSGTSGSQLYIGDDAYGTAQTTFSNNGQSVHLSNVSLTQSQTIAVRARARGTSYYMYVGNLTIIEA